MICTPGKSIISHKGETEKFELAGRPGSSGGVGLVVVVGTTALEFFRGLPRSFWSSTAADASGAAASGTSLPTGTLDPSAKADMPGVVINHNILALYIYYSFRGNCVQNCLN